MRILSLRPMLALAPLVLLVAGCPGGSVNVTETTLAVANRGTEYATIGRIDPSGSCQPAPTPAAPDVNAWWTGIDPQTRARVVVGGMELWSNSNPGCTSFRQDIYHGLWVHDLAPLAALSTTNSPIQSRISSATIRLEVQGGTQSTSAGGATCRAGSGGVKDFAIIRPGGSVLTGLNKVGGPVTAPAFTPLAVQADLSTVPVPGTAGRVTTSVGGGGVTVVDIDVKDLVIGALNRGDATLGFALTSAAETLLGPTGAVFLDCKTFTTPGSIVVRSL